MSKQNRIRIVELGMSREQRKRKKKKGKDLNEVRWERRTHFSLTLLPSPAMTIP